MAKRILHQMGGRAMVKGVRGVRVTKPVGGYILGKPRGGRRIADNPPDLLTG